MQNLNTLKGTAETLPVDLFEAEPLKMYQKIFVYS